MEEKGGKKRFSDLEPPFIYTTLKSTIFCVKTLSCAHTYKASDSILHLKWDQ